MATTRTVKNSVEADTILSLMGESVRRAYKTAKRAGLANNRRPRTGRHYASGREHSPLSRTADMIRNADNPWAIIADLATVAAMQFMDMPEHELRPAFQRAHELEAKCEGIGNVHEAELRRTGDYKALRIADSHEVAASLERMAITLVCEIRGVDLGAAD